MSAKLTPEQWKKLYTAFDPFRPLPANDPAWVDCAAVRGDEDILLGLGDEILQTDGVTCQLYAGHRGAGKSTELLRLKEELQKQQRRVVYFEVDDGDLNPEDTQYSDVLLACARYLIDQLKPNLHADSKFWVWMHRLYKDFRDLGLQELSLDELEYETPETPLGKISATIKTSTNHRQKIRQQIEQEADSLIDILNEFIVEALGGRSADSLVLIVDNLDRIIERYEDKDQPSNYEQIFINHSDQLKRLNCHVIYTVPISLAYSRRQTLLEERYKPVDVLPMLMVKDESNHPCETGMEKLKQLILKRFHSIDKSLTLGNIFETTAAVDKICEMSGGHVRHLMHLMKAALKHTKDLPIPDRAVQRAISELRETYNREIDGNEWAYLVKVDTDKAILERDDVFRSLLFRRCILEYRYLDDEGGIVVWHDIHPLIRGLKGFQRLVQPVGGG
jgi:AAA ATPase domain